MHCSESAKPTVAASPQGSLIVILKDNTKSTWQFRQFKAEATQTVRKVEQIHRHLHRHSHPSPSKHSMSRGTANTENTHSLISAHIQTLLCTGVHQNPSICPHTYWLLLTHQVPHTSRLTFTSVSYPGFSTHQLGTGSWACLTEDSYLLTM